MKRLKITGIVLIAIIGAYIIYNHFDNKDTVNEVKDKFIEEYTLLEDNHNFKYSSIDEIIDILSNKTGIVYFCTPTSEWCQFYTYYLNEAVKDTDLIINYLDLKEYRELKTVKYQRVLELLDAYLYKDDSNNRKIYMPDLTFVKDGTIIAHNNDTSLVSSEMIVDEYYSKNKINEFVNEIKNNIELLNNNEIE